jgi:phosphatidylethanolamine/phosphatidyl-N-methylethanolamine N-methyltransferase
VSKKEFFSAFLKQSKNVGAVAPSSKYLVKKMVDPIDFSKVKCIVEFGPGTGSITHELLNQMPKDAILLAFEINAEFCEMLKQINDPRIKIISDTAESLETYLEENNIGKVDYIISSLPLAMIPNGIVRNILHVVKKVLSPAGAFVQYQYSLNAYKKLKATFRNVDVNFTPINIPPAFVFVCKD